MVLVVDAARARRGPRAGAPFVASDDLWTLEAIARSRLESDDPIGRALAEKLERCVILPPGAIISGLATLSSRVVLSLGGRAAQARVLVGTEEKHAFPKSALPVATPLGVAVLGLMAGSKAVVRHNDGRTEEVQVLSVAHLPQAVRRAPVPRTRAERGGADRLATVGALSPGHGQ
ncbi:hypothetical protein [Siccirubricoccus sp. G192]|uniref:hypothetical protein n=1 Tax=Siccirubricoccus sp. G192 TaxID=2849651 RepID=UPI001C2CB3C5|nr:hypothetical protein [Siccirubricoccus sp. G192]MBV1795731.1 hypothetical protein [Siccirubricoccus sp. G192]